MRTMSVGEFKTHFSEALKSVEAGERIAITYGKKKEIKALLVPKEEQRKQRKLGILKHEKYSMSADFTITTNDEFEV